MYIFLPLLQSRGSEDHAVADVERHREKEKRKPDSDPAMNPIIIALEKPQSAPV